MTGDAAPGGAAAAVAASVDVHAHCVPDGVLAQLRADSGRWGIEVGVQEGKVTALVAGRVRTGVIRADLFDPYRRLAAMDDADIDVQILSSWIDLTAYALPPDVGVDYARMFNEALAATAAAHPGRFEALATVPLQDPAAAAAELVHAVGSLGMVGAEIATTVDGRDLDDPSLEPFWGAAEELRCPVLVHPYAALAGRGLCRWFLGNLVGNPAESTIAAAHLIFGGVLEKFPDLRICLVHGGGFAAYQLGRWDHGYAQDARGAATNLTRSPREWLTSMHHDTVLHSPAAVRFLLDTVGADRVLLGSDHPFEMGDSNPLATLSAVPGITAQERELVAAGNLRRLLADIRR